MRNVIVVSDLGPDADIVTQLRDAGVATVSEAMGRSGLLATYMRPIYSGARIAGRAVTALCQAGDNLMIHAAIEQCRPGDVLVVGVMSPSTDGVFGELLATGLRARGVAGVIIDAGARDIADLTEMKFPVWSKAISAHGTVKATGGSVNVPITVANALVSPGDVIVADDDGVVVVPLAEAKATAQASLERIRSEEDKRREFQAGTLSLDLMDLRSTLRAVGVTYVDPADAGK